MKAPVRYAAVLGCLAVLLGAFGAHALESRLDPKALTIWGTANRYHFLHALAIFGLELGAGLGLKGTRPSLILWSVGLVLFSGGLYTYALTGLKFAALIAPLGGLSFAAGWLSLTRITAEN